MIPNYPLTTTLLFTGIKKIIIIIILAPSVAQLVGALCCTRTVAVAAAVPGQVCNNGDETVALSLSH